MISKSIRERGAVFITRKWPPAVGGMERYSVELARELERHIPLQTIYLPGRPDGSPPSFAARIGFGFSAVARYLRLRTTPAILHIGDIASWPLALLAYAKSPRPQIVLSAHGTDVSFPRRKGFKGKAYGGYLRFGSRLLKKASVIANSQATAAAAAEAGWRVDAVVPLATRIAGDGVPDRVGGNLLFAGRLIPQKGCAWFIREVLPRLPDNLRLKVAGSVWDKGEASAIVNPRVDFLGALDTDSLIAEYRQALCVVVPNINRESGEFEGFGLVAVEAAAAGGVVVAARTGGLIDAVIDGETGFLVSSGDAAQWVEKILELASWSSRDRHEFIGRSMRRTCQSFGWSRVGKDVLEVYGR